MKARLQIEGPRSQFGDWLNHMYFQFKSSNTKIPIEFFHQHLTGIIVPNLELLNLNITEFNGACPKLLNCYYLRVKQIAAN